MIVSVIIPFYDGNKYIKQIDHMMVSNAKNLQGNNLELVLVNDSPWIDIDITQMSRNGYELTIVRNQQNLGIHGSRVQGLKKAKGEYVLMLDQDDRISNSCLEKHLSTIGNTDVSVSNGYKYKDGQKTKIYGSSKQQEKVKNEFLYIYLENRILSPGQCLVKKSSIPSKWYDIIMHKNGADDMLLWVMMLEDKRKFTMIRDCLYMHVFTGENVSADDLKMAASTIEMLDILKKNNILNRRNQHLLKRKIENDIHYVKTGKDLYIDYKLIECVRKVLHRSR